jgi:GT2 family glycosyltransferase
VVDNNSTDGSSKMIKKEFPYCKLIQNKVNAGFSKANNQAIKKAKGEYILLLNPDTIIEEDTLKKCLAFMSKKNNAGSLGVKMIDGNGKFLPESKRSFPTPLVAFYKIFGLSTLFPRSKRFGTYHLSFLDKDKIHEVDVLSGAFLLIRKKVLDKIGLLDEKFFMYGEDIDISYRIQKAGFKNYYFPKTKIIHYKGESTKKSSVNYVFIFYRAMIIFAKKHFKKNNAFLLSFLINIAIYFRAILSITKRFFNDLGIALVDTLVIYFGIFFLKNYWEKISLELVGEQKILPEEFMTITIPICAIIWILCIYLQNGYEKPFTTKKILKGTMFGSIIILIIYALLPESYRSSRILILFGSLWTIMSLSFYRKILDFLGFKNFKKVRKRIGIIGTLEEFKRIEKLLNENLNTNFIKHIYIKKIKSKKKLHHLSKIEEIVKIHEINEIIFCSKNISFNEIMNQMNVLKKYPISIRIASNKSTFVIGSDSKKSKGEIIY